MLITIFGANGGTGRHVVEEALARGDEVYAVVRNPDSLGIRHERLTVARGNVLDPASIEVRGDLVISGIGARSRKDDSIASQGTAGILTAMKRAGVKRIVTISAAPLGEVQPGAGLFERLLYGFLRWMLRPVYDDLRRMEARLREANVDWTVMRPPRLTNGPRTEKYRTARDGNVGKTIARADLAHEMLHVLGDPSTIRHTVGIGY